MHSLKIIHVDMDAFYAAVEVRDNPALEGKPLVIGGDNPQQRGVVATCSYEARKFGIHSAMPLSEAFRRCPHAIFMAGNHQRYQEVSQKLMAIFRKYTPLIEPLSLDEAFLDVTGCERLFGEPITIARKIKAEIKEKCGLNASFGIAPNKFLAKIASDIEKPQGFVVVSKNDIGKFLNPLPVEKMWGVGPKTSATLRSLGIDTIGKIAQMDPKLLSSRLGVGGRQIWELAQGIDQRQVETMRVVKSVGKEYTFAQNITDLDYLEAVLCLLTENISRRLFLGAQEGTIVTLKLRYGDFKTITRRLKLSLSTQSSQIIYRAAKKLLSNLDLHGKSIRLIGISVSGLIVDAQLPPPLFPQWDLEKENRREQVVQEIKDRFGEQGIFTARIMELKDKEK